MIKSIHVHYGQASVESGLEAAEVDMAREFRGQPQGLVGAMRAGFLFLNIGLHTGRVGFDVRIHDHEPPVDNGYEDIVEVSFRPTTDDVRLVEWAAEATYPLPLRAIDYRVRYSARHGRCA
jgi:hypothetical protein